LKSKEGEGGVGFAVFAREAAQGGNVLAHRLEIAAGQWAGPRRMRAEALEIG
jgi:hypothetical protein